MIQGSRVLQLDGVMLCKCTKFMHVDVDEITYSHTSVDGSLLYYTTFLISVTISSKNLRPVTLPILDSSIKSSLSNKVCGNSCLS